VLELIFLLEGHFSLQIKSVFCWFFQKDAAIAWASFRNRDWWDQACVGSASNGLLSVAWIIHKC